MHIAPATIADADAILALQRRAYAEEAARYDDWSIPPLTETLDALQQAFATTTILKAIDGDTLIGSVRGKKEHSRLMAVFIHMASGLVFQGEYCALSPFMLALVRWARSTSLRSMTRKMVVPSFISATA